MAVRVADSLKQQNDLKTFPVAYSEDIWLDENKGEGDANYKDLQTLFNENKLGGSGLPEPESADKVLLSASSNTRADGLEWKQVSKNDVGLQLPEFESLEEWDSLPADEKSKYYNAGKGYVVIKEDVKGAKGVIDDTKPTSTVTTLSAKKINDSLVGIESALDHRAYINYGTTESDANNLPDGFVSSNNLKNAPVGGHVFYRTFSYDGNSEYRAQEATTIGNARKFIRYKNGGTWFAWQELATMDKVEQAPIVDTKGKSIFSLVPSESIIRVSYIGMFSDTPSGAGSYGLVEYIRFYDGVKIEFHPTTDAPTYYCFYHPSIGNHTEWKSM